jgi:hypothetical protein
MLLVTNNLGISGAKPCYVVNLCGSAHRILSQNTSVLSYRRKDIIIIRQTSIISFILSQRLKNKLLKLLFYCSESFLYFYSIRNTLDIDHVLQSK